MGRRKTGTRPIWQQISVSKLETFHRCPKQFEYDYLEKPEVDVSHWVVLGEELHGMFARFFTHNFKSKESFLNTWQHRWWGVVKGTYGQHQGKIRWRGDADAGACYGRGRKILSIFWDENLPYKLGQSGYLKPLAVEKRIPPSVKFGGFRVSGIFDRIQPYLDDTDERRIAIIDYKTGRSRIDQAEQSIVVMWTLYQIAFQLMYGFPPDRLELHWFPSSTDDQGNYVIKYTKTLVQPRQRWQFDDLLVMFREYHDVVKTILEHRQSVESSQPGQKRLDLWGDEDTRLTIFPKRPGRQCKYCDYDSLCQPPIVIDALTPNASGEPPPVQFNKTDLWAKIVEALSGPSVKTELPTQPILKLRKYTKRAKLKPIVPPP